MSDLFYAKKILSLTFLALLLFAPVAFAKEQDCCWVDVKTGKRVPTAPLAGVNTGMAATLNAGVAEVSADGKSARNTRTGKQYAKEPDGCWVDVKTGRRVPTVPLAGVNTGMAATLNAGVAEVSADGKSARNTRTGKQYALEPCPPPGQATGDTIKKVLQSVHIGIGIGGGRTFGHDEHHHGEDRHRTAEKVSTDKTKTHTTSPTTTRKTVTSACKCHPCTCAPCTCH